MSLVLLCDKCGQPTRPRNRNMKCPYCKEGRLTARENLKPKSEPISVGSVFKQTAADKNIRVSEKIL